MKHWISDAPAWLSSLTRDETTRNETLTITWLSETHAGDAQTDFAAYDDARFGDSPLGAAMRARRARGVIVGRGPERTRRLTTTTQTIWFVFDPAEPSQLFASFGIEFPSLLWLPVGTTMATISAALAPYLVAAAPGVLPTTGRCRYLVAAGHDAANTFADVQGYHDGYEAWLDGGTSWGSAYDEDPWDEECAPFDNALTGMYRARENNQQSPNRPRAQSWRTLFSRTVLRLEEHPIGALVIELQYPQHAPSEVIAAVNREYNTALPVDAPLDLAASVLNAGSRTLANIERAVAAEGISPYWVLATCALDPSSPQTQAKLATWVRDPEFGVTAVEIASAFGWRQVLLAHAATADAAVAENIFAWLARAAEVPAETNGDDDDSDDYEDEDE